MVRLDLWKGLKIPKIEENIRKIEINSFEICKITILVSFFQPLLANFKITTFLSLSSFRQKLKLLNSVVAESNAAI